MFKMNLKWNLNSKKKNKNELITVNKLKRLIGNARGGWKNLITIERKFCIVVTSESVSEHKSIFISLSTCIFFTTSENQNFSLHCTLVDVRALIWLVLRWKTTQTFPSIFIFYFFFTLGWAKFSCVCGKPKYSMNDRKNIFFLLQ